MHERPAARLRNLSNDLKDVADPVPLHEGLLGDAFNGRGPSSFKLALHVGDQLIDVGPHGCRQRIRHTGDVALSDSDAWPCDSTRRILCECRTTAQRSCTRQRSSDQIRSAHAYGLTRIFNDSSLQATDGRVKRLSGDW
jgi:hypothetical protein